MMYLGGKLAIVIARPYCNTIIHHDKALEIVQG